VLEARPLAGSYVNAYFSFMYSDDDDVDVAGAAALLPP
jgi:hypothetical protein